MKREGDTLFAILTVAAIVLVVVLVVKGAEKFLGLGEEAVLPNTAESACVTKYVLGDPHLLAAYILGETKADFVAVWTMEDGLLGLAAINDGLLYRWAICPTSETEMTWASTRAPEPVVK